MSFDFHYHPSRHSARHIVLWIVAIAFFMENLDSTILVTAIPHIAFAFGVYPLALRVTLTSYLISVAMMTAFSAWLGDRFGSKPVFILALFIFTLGSWLCALSYNLNMLIMARVLQGMGGGLMIPTARIMVMTSFPRSEMTRLLSLIAMPVLVGPMLGPLVGGAITTYGNWRWIFYINIPIGFLGIFATMRYFIELGKRTPRSLDFLGFVYAAVGLAMLSYFLEVANDPNMVSLTKGMIFLVAVGSLYAYSEHAKRSKNPLVDLKIFDIRTYRLTFFAQFVFRLSSGGLSFILPLMLQLEFGLNAFQAGLMFAAMPIGTLLTKSIVQKILKRFGFKKTVLVNTVLTSLAIVLMTQIHEPLNIVYTLMVFFLVGLTTSAQFTSLNSLLYADLNEAQITHGATMMSLMQQIFTSIGIASVALIVECYAGTIHLTTGNLSAFHWTFFTLMMINLFNLFLLFRLRAEDGSSMVHRSGNQKFHRKK